MPTRANLTLTGFMLTGKTTVGRIVAERLGREFVDTDAVIEARTAKSVRQIFAEDGEPAFRQMERELCLELSRAEGLVIATGGGTLVDPVNRHSLARSSTLVCLDCEVDAILARLAGLPLGERPMLGTGDPRTTVERLLAARQAAYAGAPWHVDTTRITPAQAAECVLGLADAVSLSVHSPGGAYPVHITHGALDLIGGLARAAGAPPGSRVAVVSNPIVARLYWPAVEASLRAVGFAAFLCTVPDGEQHKTLASLATLYDQFLAGDLERSDTVLALGGGVVGDLAGFAAATYMRGVRLIPVPTTLLAMVDASVGGKTGVDLPQGKNLVGVFKAPAAVVIDPAVLASLSAEQVGCGMAELIKHAVLGDPELFAEVQDAPRPEPWRDWIARGLAVKIKVVEEDPFERGRRMALNLGHTVGHALEKVTAYRLGHGQAVGIGLVAAARLAVELSRAEPHLPERIERVLAMWGLPVRCLPIEVDDILVAMLHDKKKLGQRLRWILPRDIGEVEIADDVASRVVRRVLIGMGAIGEP